MTVTPLYAAVLGIVFLVLSVRVLRLRRCKQIAIGDAGDEEMLRAMRVHSNFAEYAPFTLLLILMLESTGVAPGWVHALCLSLLVGRLVHGVGVSRAQEDYRFRVVGMTLTLTALFGAALGLVLGLPFGLAGWLIGPFVGVLAFEYRKAPNLRSALKAGTGSVLGLLAGTALKVAMSVGMVVLACWWAVKP